MDQTPRQITTRYALNPTTKQVIAEFSEPVNNLSMPPQEAVRMAQILLACARELDPASTEGHTWVGMDKKPEMTPINAPNALPA